MKTKQIEIRLRQIGVMIVGILILTLIVARNAQAEVITVCLDGTAYPTVQSAMDAANPSGIIEGCAATNSEPLHIDSDLFLGRAGQSIMIISSQAMTTVVSLGPDTTVSLMDLTSAQEDDRTFDEISAASMQPYTDTLAITNTLYLTGTDQVTTIINGDVGGNVAIVQANTKVYVVNVTFSLSSSAPDSIATWADDKIAALADAAVQSIFSNVTSLALQGGEQVTTIVNGDIGGNLVIIQANTTVDVIGLTISVLDEEATLPTNFSAVDAGQAGKSYVLFIPVVNR